ncbi:MAG: kinase, partial [Acinetobacter sp.]
FVLHNDRWWLVNEGLTDLTDVTTKTVIPIGGKIELKNGVQILLSKQEGGRLAVVQMVEA